MLINLLCLTWQRPWWTCTVMSITFSITDLSQLSYSLFNLTQLYSGVGTSRHDLTRRGFQGENFIAAILQSTFTNLSKTGTKKSRSPKQYASLVRTRAHLVIHLLNLMVSVAMLRCDSPLELHTCAWLHALGKPLNWYNVSWTTPLLFNFFLQLLLSSDSMLHNSCYWRSNDPSLCICSFFT